MDAFEKLTKRMEAAKVSIRILSESLQKNAELIERLTKENRDLRRALEDVGEGDEQQNIEQRNYE